MAARPAAKCAEVKGDDSQTSGYSRRGASLTEVDTSTQQTAVSYAPTGPRKVQRCSLEFKREAVADALERFAFVARERETFGVARLCRLFWVTRPGFYA